MPWLKFDYYKVPIPKDAFQRSSLLRPIIPIKVLYKEKFIIYYALLDTGADFCIFHAEAGEALGINVNAGKEYGFAGIQQEKNSRAFLHEVTLDIAGQKVKTLVAFSRDISDKGYSVLGQKGFFEHFPTKFDYAKERIEIQIR